MRMRRPARQADEQAAQMRAARALPCEDSGGSGGIGCGGGRAERRLNAEVAPQAGAHLSAVFNGAAREAHEQRGAHAGREGEEQRHVLRGQLAPILAQQRLERLVHEPAGDELLQRVGEERHEPDAPLTLEPALLRERTQLQRAACRLLRGLVSSLLLLAERFGGRAVLMLKHRARVEVGGEPLEPLQVGPVARLALHLQQQLARLEESAERRRLRRTTRAARSVHAVRAARVTRADRDWR